MTKRKLVFQELDQNSVGQVEIRPGIEAKSSVGINRSSVFWLLTLMILIVCMVSVGGMTRLTDSGLSIVEWNPITGIFLPLSEEQWLIEFSKYKLIPEFLLVNSDMTIQEFKYIYLWEWGHRQLGRLIGLVWLLGFLWLSIKNLIPHGWRIKFLLIGILIGIQGFIGWWMVYSGLMPEMTDVASYRLATHLGMAFLIVGLILWYILSLRINFESIMLRRRNRDKKLYLLLNIYLFTLFFQIIFGALVAGIDAGTAYTDWPLMSGKLFPSEYWSLDGAVENLLANPATVQFNHRVLAYLLFALGCFTFFQSRKNPIFFVKRIHSFLLIILIGQVLLGIFTVLSGSQYQFAIVHQLLALMLWLMVIWVRFETAFPRRQSLN